MVVEEPLASSVELLLLDLELVVAVLSRSRYGPPMSKRSLMHAWLPGVFVLLECFLWPVLLPSVGTLPMLMRAPLPLPLARALPVLVAAGFPLPLAEALPLTLSLPESLLEEPPGALPHSSDHLERWVAAPMLYFLVPYIL